VTCLGRRSGERLESRHGTVPWKKKCINAVFNGCQLTNLRAFGSLFRNSQLNDDGSAALKQRLCDRAIFRIRGLLAANSEPCQAGIASLLFLSLLVDKLVSGALFNSVTDQHSAM